MITSGVPCGRPGCSAGRYRNRFDEECPCFEQREISDTLERCRAGRLRRLLQIELASRIQSADSSLIDDDDDDEPYSGTAQGGRTCGAKRDRDTFTVEEDLEDGDDILPSACDRCGQPCVQPRRSLRVKEGEDIAKFACPRRCGFLVCSACSPFGLPPACEVCSIAAGFDAGTSLEHSPLKCVALF